MSIHRFSLNFLARMSHFVPGASISSMASPIYSDINLADDANLPDLISFMETQGYDYKEIVTTSLLSLKQKYSIHSSKFEFMGAGTYQLVPAPPAGYLRYVGSGLTSDTIVSGISIAPSDGVITGNNMGTYSWDGITKKGILPIEWVVGASETYLLSNRQTYLSPGEDLTLEVSAINGGADRLVGTITYYDILIDNTEIFQENFSLTSDITIFTVPANTIYTSPILNSSPLILYNPDDVLHSFRISIEDGSGVSLINNFPPTDYLLGSLETMELPSAMPFPEGVVYKISMSLVTPVSTVAPWFTGVFSKLIQ